MRTLHLFAGAGGGLLADLVLGHRPVCAVEWDAHCCAVLRERAADGWFPGLHVHEGDVRLFDPSTWSGRVDCVHAGFPCQDISVAGKGGGGWPVSAADCGAKCGVPSAFFDPLTCSLRTAQQSLAEDSTACSLTLPRSGTMLGGWCWELTTSALGTSESVGGAEAGWPTPTASMSKQGGHYGNGQPTLSSAVAMWPTPCASNPNEGETLTSWQERRERVKATAKNGNGFGMPLSIAVRLWPTPTVSEAERGHGYQRARGKVYETLTGAVGAAPNAPGKRGSTAGGGQLNPTWVEWLMGWPLAWTACAALATARSRSAPPRRGASSEGRDT